MCTSGSQRSAFCGNLKPSGITPITMAGTSLTLTVRPITEGSLPYRFFHTPLPRITTATAPGRSSSGRKSRPSSGDWPISLNAFAEMYGP